jgi:hypothetical protein
MMTRTPNHAQSDMDDGLSPRSYLGALHGAAASLLSPAGAAHSQGSHASVGQSGLSKAVTALIAERNRFIGGAPTEPTRPEGSGLSRAVTDIINRNAAHGDVAASDPAGPGASGLSKAVDARVAAMRGHDRG